MIIFRAFIICVLFSILASCSTPPSVEEGGNALIQTVTELRNGKYQSRIYELRATINEYAVIVSNDEKKQILLVRASDFGRRIPFGSWTSIDKVDVKNWTELVSVMEKLSRGTVRILIRDLSANRPSTDHDFPDVKGSGRLKFNGRSAAEKCVAYFQSGKMPRRVMIKNKSFMFDCVLPKMRDSGYILEIYADDDNVSIVGIDFYVYDRIPIVE